MSGSLALAGFIGFPCELNVPARSMKRIQNAIFSLDSPRAIKDVQIAFQAVETPAGDNISELRVTAVQREAIVTVVIVYRNRKFRVAWVETDGKKAGDLTLSQAIGQVALL